MIICYDDGLYLHNHGNAKSFPWCLGAYDTMKMTFLCYIDATESWALRSFEMLDLFIAYDTTSVRSVSRFMSYLND
jgi:hypothetical protein